MTERDACALLKARFEKAGFAIAENIPFDEDGVQFEIDGFDAEKRVGYEYLTEEAGDGWDVGADVIAALAERFEAGEVFILMVDEKDAPDAAALGRAADMFLAQLDEPAKKPAKKTARKAKATTPPRAKSPTKKPATKKAAKKS